jgi:hypothetical protein
MVKTPMVKTMIKMRQIQTVTTLCALGSTLLFGLPVMAQFRVLETDSDAYRRCGRDLASAKVETAIAADACASVLRPEELGRCVADLSRNQQIVALTALEACRRVHRPLELQTCVQDIQRQDKQADLTPVLQACRQSLLPVRYGRCVVGLNQSLAVATPVGLATCINASDRPQTTESDFIQLERLSRFDNAGPDQLTGAIGGSSAPVGLEQPGSGAKASQTPSQTPSQLY